MNSSAAKDDEGNEVMSSQPWRRMGVRTLSSRATEYMDKMTNVVSGGLEGDDLIRVLWLSITLFFVVGGYWLLRSLKDPIMSAIDGVEYIPQAKIASLFVVFALVIVYNKLLDIFPKHQLFYLMGVAYGVVFLLIGLLLLHPTIGLPNTEANPSRFLGWISYCVIESFGSMVVQCYWALVNASVDTAFAKKNFGLIVAGAQIGSILGPTVATQADTVGIPLLYLFGSAIMFMMVAAMYFYVLRFGVPVEGEEESTETTSLAAKKPLKKEDGGVMEGFYLFMEHDFVKGIFCISSISMIQVTIIDFLMKVLVKDKYAAMYPDDPQAAIRAFASFMGYFGQTTNAISFVFSFFGTGMVIKRFGLTATMISYPILLLVCALLVWMQPTIWVVFGVMMVMKGMSYALNNPCKEILYQATSTQIKFKCKSWIDTFGQRGSKAAGSIVTNAFANSVADLVTYGSIVGVTLSVFLVWVAQVMGRDFEEMSASGVKCGEKLTDVQDKEISEVEMGGLQNETNDTSCGLEEEGQGQNNDVPLVVSGSGSPRSSKKSVVV